VYNLTVPAVNGEVKLLLETLPATVKQPLPSPPLLWQFIQFIPKLWLSFPPATLMFVSVQSLFFLQLGVANKIVLPMNAQNRNV
jgi:hypothetical protein